MIGRYFGNMYDGAVENDPTETRFTVLCFIIRSVLHGLVVLTSPAGHRDFFSYASADEELCIELTKHLRSLERARVISGWHKRLIKAGTERDNAIHSHLETSQIILLLVSYDFLDSDYC